MIIPNLPTDNLYKFKALSGLAIIGISLILYFTELDRIFTSLYSIETELKILSLEQSYLMRDSSEQMNERKQLEIHINKAEKDIIQYEKLFKFDTTVLSEDNTFRFLFNYLNSKDKDEARRDIEFRLKHTSDFLPVAHMHQLIQEKKLKKDEIIKNIELKSIEINEKMSLIQFKYYLFTFLSILLLFALFFGMRLTFSGFNSWKKIVQEPQDEKLKMEVEQLKKSYGTKQS